MEIKKEKEIKENGVYKTIETIETTPKDGIVPESIIHPVKNDTKRKFHMGYTKTTVYTTNDPRITRPFVYSVCGIFLIIGIFMLLSGNLFFGIIFSATAISVFFKAKKTIDKIAENLKSKGYDVTIDSEEEKEQIKEEVIGNLKDGLKDATTSTFTKDRLKWFVKKTMPIYYGMTIIISLLLSISVNIFLGLIVFIVLAIGGLFYYFILSKICKH